MSKFLLLIERIKKINPAWLIPLAIIVSIFIGVTACLATDGNVIFIFIGKLMLMVFAFFIFYGWPGGLIYYALSIRRITAREINSAGMDWQHVKTVFLENHWAEKVYFSLEGSDFEISKEIHLTVDPETLKKELRSYFGSQNDMLFPILRKNWEKKLSPMQRGAAAFFIMTAVWGLIIFCVNMIASNKVYQ